MGYIHYRNLEDREGDPLRDLLEHLPILLDKVHEDKVILRIISETIMYEFINMNGMVVGTPAVTPQSVISQRGQPCPSLPVSVFMKGGGNIMKSVKWFYGRLPAEMTVVLTGRRKSISLRTFSLSI